MKIAQMLLTYLQTHPTAYHRIPREAQNVVAFRLPDTVIFPYQQQLFPNDRLEATRVDDDFIQQEPALIAWLANLIDPDEPPVPQSLWLTLSHVTQAHANFIEVSFE
ncbi:hypothetical protein ACFQ5J_06585 [Lacticaseibacillus baoqingensis]|uniref:Uncharacterized protein n=1 Tax=Lacticaseibacillus baoqingensis TaxID=2486013 RepID=A0ABW4E6V6_9LACO|nr:hypothetical protein [Lacticaseibacillus baoqingensis]